MAENIHKTFYFANTAKNKTKTNTNLKTGCAHQNSGKSIGLKLALFHVFVFSYESTSGLKRPQR